MQAECSPRTQTRRKLDQRERRKIKEELRGKLTPYVFHLPSRERTFTLCVLDTTIIVALYLYSKTALVKAGRNVEKTDVSRNVLLRCIKSGRAEITGMLNDLKSRSEAI